MFIESHLTQLISHSWDSTFIHARSPGVGHNLTLFKTDHSAQNIRHGNWIGDNQKRFKTTISLMAMIVSYTNEVHIYSFSFPNH